MLFKENINNTQSKSTSTSIQLPPLLEKKKNYVFDDKNKFSERLNELSKLQEDENDLTVLKDNILSVSI